MGQSVGSQCLATTVAPHLTHCMTLGKSSPSLGHCPHLEIPLSDH